MTKFKFLPILSLLLSAALTSCLGDDTNDFSEWKRQNEDYLTECKNSISDGKQEYEVVTPVFAPGTYVLMKWHNDRSKTADNLSPLDNSTVDCVYICRDIDGKYIDSSYYTATYGDSIYRTQPTKNIAGFWTALTHMNVGDSVTVVIPYAAGYGEVKYGSIKPYSTLVYGIKLKGIPAYELPK